MFWCFFGRRFMKHGSWKGWKGGITAIWSPGATTLNPFRRREISRTLWPSMAWGMWFASKKPNKNINKGLGSTQKWIRDRHRFVPKVCVPENPKNYHQICPEAKCHKSCFTYFYTKKPVIHNFPTDFPMKSFPVGPQQLGPPCRAGAQCCSATQRCVDRGQPHGSVAGVLLQGSAPEFDALDLGKL